MVKKPERLNPPINTPNYDGQRPSKGKGNLMAKLETLAVLVNVASVYWNRELNLARMSGDYGDTKELRNSFIQKGWAKTGDGIIDVEKITDDIRNRALTERQEQWDGLKSLAVTNADKIIELKVFEEVYTVNGKLRPVDYVGVSGNRRSSVLMAAQIERRKLNLPLITEIPVIVKEFADSLERLETQIQENEGKTVGFMKMNPLDCLRAAKKAVELGATQSRLRKAFTDTTGQKLWGIIKLDQRYPTLNLYDRMNRSPDDPDFIRIESVKGPSLPGLVERSDPEALAEKNAKQKQRGLSPIESATQGEIEEFFTSKGESDPKMMAKKIVENLVQSFPAIPMRVMAKAILKNNTTILEPYQVASTGFNILDNICRNGDYPAVELLLSKIETAGEGRKELLKKLLDVVK